MSPYITLGAKDPATSHAFYQAVLATIGWAAHAEFPGGWVAYSEAGRGEGFHFWVCPPFNGAPATAGNGMMLGLPARSRAEVDAFYGPNWYAAYLRDPSGNKLAVVCNS